MCWLVGRVGQVSSGEIQSEKAPSATNADADLPADGRAREMNSGSPEAESEPEFEANADSYVDPHRPRTGDAQPLGRGEWRGPTRSFALSNIIALVGIPAAALFAFATTLFLLSPSAETVARPTLLALIIGNVVIAGALAVLIGARLWHVLAERRNRLAGADTHLQLVGIFALVAGVPAFFAFVFAFTIMRSSLNDVFGDRIETSIDASRELANGYIEEKFVEDERHLAQIEFDISNDRLLGISYETTPILFRQRLFDQAYGRGLAAIFILDKDRRIIARSEMVEAPFAFPEKSVFDRIDAAAEAGRPRNEQISYGANNREDLDFLRGMIKSKTVDDGYIVIYRALQDDIRLGLIGIRTISNDWSGVKTQRVRLERVFLAGYIIMGLIVLFGAIWAALRAATQIVDPIGRLMRMAQRVSGGDLAARVDVFKHDGELGALARSMNHMTAQLQTQRDDLIDTNRQFDRRRRFTEAVLSNVSAGVVGISADGDVSIANRSAEELLMFDSSATIGAPVAEMIPELSGLIERAIAATGGEASQQLEIEREGQTRILNVRVVSESGVDGHGCVATFDDVTELIAAHRSAAWGDVARRIAHEIKNPLTPIQLSAERLKRKYGREISSTPEVFDKCVETIVRHVSDIRRMVDEFSSFARMPEPVIGRENIVELAKSAIFTQRVTFPEIEFELSEPGKDLIVSCDGRLIVQALGNLMKNACEAVDARLIVRPSPSGKICIEIIFDDRDVKLRVIDNGVGLPKAERHRLTEPYMTTRSKGTGLGLAIVKKVIEEHEGELSFADSSLLGETGACVCVRLPLADGVSADLSGEVNSEQIHTDSFEDGSGNPPAHAAE
ncbi:MAG: PAS domain-containing sensor histidine kinase [Parvularculaceae bacterium]|nr:MAG: PAS domain-containing sensor histidine kinase [Parvularculaceae bacterium]